MANIAKKKEKLDKTQAVRKSKGKISSDYFRRIFDEAFQKKYRVGYVGKIVVDRSIMKTLMEAYSVGQLTAIINYYVENYSTMQGVNTQTFPTPSIGHLRTCVNRFAHVAIAEVPKTSVLNDSESEDDAKRDSEFKGLSF